MPTALRGLCGRLDSCPQPSSYEWCHADNANSYALPSTLGYTVSLTLGTSVRVVETLPSSR